MDIVKKGFYFGAIISSVLTSIFNYSLMDLLFIGLMILSFELVISYRKETSKIKSKKKKIKVSKIK